MKVLSISILFAVTLAMAVQVLEPQNDQLRVENDPGCRYEGTMTFAQLREFVRGPKFIECCERQDAEDRARDGNTEQQVARFRPSGQEQGREGNENKEHSAPSLEDLKAGLSKYVTQLSSCYEKGVLNVDRYYYVRYAIFDIEKKIVGFPSNSDEKASAMSYLQTVLSWVKQVEATANKDCEKNPSNACLQFNPQRFSKSAHFLQDGLVSLRSRVINIQPASPNLSEYSETYRTLYGYFFILKNVDMRYFKESPFYDDLQRQLGDLANLMSSVKSAFEEKGVRV